MKIKHSVVLCSRNRERELRRCLDGLKKCGGKWMEVVVVGLDREKVVVDRFGGGLVVRFVRDEKKGLSYARDAGWKNARGDIVSWIDDDVVVGKKWASKLLGIFRGNPDVGGVSGPTIIPENMLENRAVFFWYKPRGLFWKVVGWLWVRLVLCGDPFEVGRIFWHGWWSPGSNFRSSLKIKGLKDVDYLEACNMSLRRDLVDRVGGYDLGYVGTSEWCEVDVSMRVKHEIGCRLVFNSDVRVDHKVSQFGVYVDRRRIVERLYNFARYSVRRMKWS